MKNRCICAASFQYTLINKKYAIIFIEQSIILRQYPENLRYCLFNILFNTIYKHRKLTILG